MEEYSQEDLESIGAILDATAEIAPAGREAFVLAQCQTRPRLLDLALQLVRGMDDAADLVAPPEGEQRQGPLAGQRLGPYRLHHLIGKGGFGEVYAAARTDPVKSVSAVKVMLPEYSVPAFEERFSLEMGILRGLSHPHIVRLVDHGRARGRLYLVMEWIEGQPIDAYCRQHDLPLRARLELFRQVCDAVREAHRVPIIHCDLKPGNILVDSGGNVKLIDFGFARFPRPEFSPDPLAALRNSERAFTPGFTSLEQMRGQPLTLAGDVFSLGALLYLLICGTLPFPVNGLSPREYSRVLEEREAEAPSRRGGPFRRRAIAGDLDAIVLKALRREPGRRYRDAAELLADLEAHLTNYPVSARAARNSWYSAGRFVARHPVSLGAALAAMIALSLTTGFAIRERHRAEQQREAIADAMVKLGSESSHGPIQLSRVMEQLGDELLRRHSEMARTMYSESLKLAKDDDCQPCQAGLEAKLQKLGSGSLPFGEEPLQLDLSTYRQHLADTYRHAAEVLETSGEPRLAAEMRRMSEDQLKPQSGTVKK
jgi:serine/threonine-protein kinase